MATAAIAPSAITERARNGHAPFLKRTLPHSQTRAILAFGLFASVQIADAAFTALGVARFGFLAEANPLVHSYMESCGLLGGLCITKAVAIASGAILHLAARYLALALLTVIFVFGALVPWAWALAAP